MSTCTVCCDKYNKTQRKKVTCPHCNYEACKTCIQTYLLSTTEEPHCMKCKHEHDREFIDSFCTKRLGMLNIEDIGNRFYTNVKWHECQKHNHTQNIE